VAAFISISHILLYGSDLTPSVYYAIWETNITEAFDYISDYLNFSSIILFILIISISTFSILKLKQVKLDRYNRKYIIILVSLLIAIGIISADYQKTLPFRFISNFYQYKAELKEFKSQIEIRNNKDFKNLNPIYCSDTTQQTIVLVIGESASKYHQGIYGYVRQTNPLLTEIKDELYVYTDVIAPHSHTNPVLSKVLSFANHESMKALYENRSIIEYMNDAGYYTCWLSNQQFAHKYTTVSSSIAIQSDFYVFTHSNKNKDKKSYDGKLLKPLRKALGNKSKKKFIVLHLMGSHSDKQDRFPKEFKKFKGLDNIPNESYISDWDKYLINSHDNSVLYTDWLLRECIELLRINKPNSALLYFPDHGEEMYEYRDFFGHGEGNSSIYMFDIPFILWLSEGYKTTYNEMVKDLGDQLNRKYQTDDLIHSIIDLSHCYSDDFKASSSIFNPNFKFRKRIMGNQDYDELIKTKKSITD
jgi:heptose-I-phosphate ethanolaminephosphotransferase